MIINDTFNKIVYSSCLDQINEDKEVEITQFFDP